MFLVFSKFISVSMPISMSASLGDNTVALKFNKSSASSRTVDVLDIDILEVEEEL